MAKANSPSKSFRLTIPILRSNSKSNSSAATASACASPCANSTPKASTRDAELRKVFCYFDSNNDGKISMEELRAYFMSVGDSISEDDAQRVIKEFDRDGDNLLEFNDFVRLLTQDRQQDDGEDIKKAFEMFEVEKGSGCITPKGLQLVLNRLGGSKSLEECKAMIRVFDLDGNGVLDFDEFHKMMS